MAFIEKTKNSNLMRFLSFLACVLLGFGAQAQNLAGTQWQLYPGAGAMGVGPNQGDTGWWSNSEGDVETRACLFDDIYAFNADGSFQNILQDATWLEGWQGVAEGCGTPVAPHDGTATATWSEDGSSVTLDGTGAFLGLAKVHNNGELSDPADAPASITYEITSLSEDAMTLDINYSFGWWRFQFVPAGTELETFDLTFEVNTANIEVGPNGMYAGGGALGDAQAVAMSDDDADGIWSATISVNEGFSGNYVFLNSPNDGGDWNAKEDLAGLPCADGPFNDRLLAPVTENTTISTCFGQCSTDGSCEQPAATVDVSFSVDMNDYPSGFGFVNLSGSLNGWCGDCNQMSDDDGDGVYEITVSLSGESTYEYKFTLDNWAVQETFIEGDACTSTIDGFTNRSLVVGSDNVNLNVVCFNSCDACTGADPISVTFQVDMSEEGANPAGVFIAGSFQGWDAGASQMSDDDGDLIYTYTQTGIPPNSNIQWKYLNGADFSFEETVPPSCNTGTNRFYDLGEEDVVLDVVCFSSCVACDVEVPQHDVTFNVNTANIEVGPNGMYLGGGDFFGDAMGHAMADDDGDGIYTVTVAVPSGYSGNYIFLNSPNDGGDWGAKEDLAGQECADGTWNDRLLPAVTEDTTLSTCFGECSEDGSCPAPPAVFHDVTFNCNTANITVGPNGMFLGGGDYFGDAMGHAMSDDDGDGIYTVTVAVPDGYSGNYIYLNSPNDGGDWNAKEDLAGQECADGTWNDRLLPTVTEATTVSACWEQCGTDGTCAAPPAMVDVQFAIDMNTTGFPNADYDNIVINGSWNGWGGWGVTLADADGDGIFTGTLNIEDGASFEFVIAATGPADGWSGWGTVFNAPEACAVAPNNYGATAAEGLVVAYCAGSCEATCPIPGCTDPFYAEFDLAATADDGSCATPVAFGCIYEAAENYNAEANTDDGSCVFELNACPGDLDGDGLVATPDLLQFLSVFGTDCE
jgi:hypothetical protein